jgi:hypothetical protein
LNRNTYNSNVYEQVVLEDLKSVNLDALEDLVGTDYGIELNEEKVLDIFTNGIDSVNISQSSRLRELW